MSTAITTSQLNSLHYGRPTTVNLQAPPPSESELLFSIHSSSFVCRLDKNL